MSNDNPAVSELPPALVTSLRTEIIETQKATADFVKWKLIACAGVASLALGVGQQKDAPHLQLLICLIPLICAYCDLVSADLAVRILSVAAFLRTKRDVYECWVEERRKERWRNPFTLAPMAVHGSSVAINLLILVGVALSGKWVEPYGALYIAAPIIGLVAAVELWCAFVVNKRHLGKYGASPPQSSP